jgi:hypothetical protein
MPWTSNDAPFKLKIKRGFKKLLKSLFTSVQNFIILILNFTLWCLKETSSMKDLLSIFNKSLNAYLAFISFTFIYIITTSSTIFVCDLVN